MRKIEEKMVQAIKNKVYFQLDNTEVVPNRFFTTVMLWKHNIADIGDKTIELSNCGHMTLTTKSRMNAILSMYGYKIYQKNFIWFIHKMYNPLYSIDIKFYNGIVLPI